MTVSVTNAVSGPYVGNGTTKGFPFTFAARSSAEVQVYLDGVATSPIGFEISVDTVDYRGGVVTFDTAPAAGVKILIASKPRFDQQVSLVDNGAFQPESVSEADDRAAIRDIFLKAGLDRSLRLPLGETALDLPSPAARAGLLLGFAPDDGRPIATTGPAGPGGPPGELDASIKIKTPYMFGAVGYDPNNPVYDTVALQAFFDDAHDEDNARLYVYDWSGEWLVDHTIYACYYDGHEPNVDRRFICGTLRFPIASSLPGGAPVDYAMEIAGYRTRWDGRLAIHTVGGGHYQYGIAYASRPYKVGLRRRACSCSTFGDILVDDARWDGVVDDSTKQAFTVRSGTLYERTFPDQNNINMETGTVFTRTCGATYSAGQTQTATSRQQGSNSNAGPNGFGANEAWSTTADTGGGQRTRVAISDTSMLRVYDFVAMRLELTPAIYGTIAADNAAKTFTWSAGDPTTYLNVGDDYPRFQGGPNLGRFKITSFSGTSNRVVHVDVAPTSHAATSDPAYQQFGVLTYHMVASVEDGTHVLVYPMIPDRQNSKLFIAAGSGLKVKGQDSANTHYAGVQSELNAVGAYIDTLYCPTISNLLCESCHVGIALSVPQENQCIGFNASHVHEEGNDIDVLVSSKYVSGRIDRRSAGDISKWIRLTDRPSSNAQDMAEQCVGSLVFEFEGKDFRSNSYFPQTYEGSSFWVEYQGVSNGPHFRQTFLHADSATVPVYYDPYLARSMSQNHWAEMVWTGPAGAAPTGTLTLNLAADITGQGWTFGGVGSGTSLAIAAPGKNVKLSFYYLHATKKVAVLRHDSA